MIEQVEGVLLKPASFMKDLPTLELSARERRLNGLDGCNRIGGAFSTKRNTIAFKQLISTRMFCATPGALQALEHNKIILTLKHVD
jgi:heat shock protein HslJ